MKASPLLPPFHTLVPGAVAALGLLLGGMSAALAVTGPGPGTRIPQSVNYCGGMLGGGFVGIVGQRTNPDEMVITVSMTLTNKTHGRLNYQVTAPAGDTTIKPMANGPAGGISASQSLGPLSLARLVGLPSAGDPAAALDRYVRQVQISCTPGSTRSE